MAAAIAALSAMERGGLVVVTDMSLAVVSVVLNLVVVTAIKEKETTIGIVNVLLANLCLSNLTRCNLVSGRFLLNKCFHLPLKSWLLCKMILS